MRGGASGRRRFLYHLALAGGAGAAAGLLWPRRLGALAARLDDVARERGQDEFWCTVRQAFSVPEDRIYLNVGTLGVQPTPVVEAVFEHTRRVAMSYPPGVDWETLKARLGAFVGADPAGFVFPRNTTEGMNFVAQGLELGPGDEVLTTDHEHIGGLCCWQLIAARRGVTLRQLPLPYLNDDPAEIVALFRDAITPRTRVISVSHVTFTTGLVIPVAEIVRLCRERGIIAVVDGAHPPGMMRVDIGALDPDFYASSPHKWLLAPQGTGFLWLREPWRRNLWPTLASGGWDDLSLGAHRFNHMGTFDESRLAGLLAAVEFMDAIGMDRIEARVRELRERLFDGLESVPGARIVSHRDRALGAGMVSFDVAGLESLDLQRRLAERANVRTRVVGEYDYGWMRLSAHIYNCEEEVDRVVGLVAEIVRGVR
ncbi:MAG: aminotransferase class V-fold PLP-dependent enzyme [Longimicrobiales bacterium]